MNLSRNVDNSGLCSRFDSICTEARANNFVVGRRPSDGRKELLTEPLDDTYKIILDGITHRSCLEIARKRLAVDIEITERKYTIAELLRADAEDRILETFAAGTTVGPCRPLSLPVLVTKRSANLPCRST
ncbi:hypothetical protein CDD83_5428 [Cordyceps sp. RAO-2017]|nr:hypothetical protein CDD83_5428 [Cordyceps sp. RAO-2017]